MLTETAASLTFPPLEPPESHAVPSPTPPLPSDDAARAEIARIFAAGLIRLFTGRRRAESAPERKDFENSGTSPLSRSRKDRSV